jgi:hypothetical protein
MKPFRLTAILVAMTGVMLVSTPAFAGKPHDRGGFFIGFGVGFGGANYTTGSVLDGSTDDSGGGVGNFRLGGALTPKVLLGLETSAWVRSENDAKLTFSAVTAALTWYPGAGGAYVRGGFGFGSSKYEIEGEVFGVPVDVSKTDGGWTFLAAGGYEWRLTDKFALGPQLEVVYMGLGGELIDTASLVNVTLQLDWYW